MRIVLADSVAKGLRRHKGTSTERLPQEWSNFNAK
jgi:hypothetical protein